MGGERNAQDAHTCSTSKCSLESPGCQGWLLQEPGCVCFAWEHGNINPVIQFKDTAVFLLCKLILKAAIMI